MQHPLMTEFQQTIQELLCRSDILLVLYLNQHQLFVHPYSRKMSALGVLDALNAFILKGELQETRRVLVMNLHVPDYEHDDKIPRMWRGGMPQQFSFLAYCQKHGHVCSFLLHDFDNDKLAVSRRAHGQQESLQSKGERAVNRRDCS
jgi:hypothetical protein